MGIHDRAASFAMKQALEGVAQGSRQARVENDFPLTRHSIALTHKAQLIAIAMASRIFVNGAPATVPRHLRSSSGRAALLPRRSDAFEMEPRNPTRRMI
jgi:hypothetical protein